MWKWIAANPLSFHSFHLEVQLPRGITHYLFATTLMASGTLLLALLLRGLYGKFNFYVSTQLCLKHTEDEGIVHHLMTTS